MGKFQEASRFYGEDAEFRTIKMQDGSTYEIPVDNIAEEETRFVPPEGYQFEDYEQEVVSFDYYQHQSRRTAGSHRTQLEAIQNWTLGLSGEAGELANLVKKAIYHNHGFPYGELVSEMGDVLWYLSQLCTALGIDMDMVADQNLKKLQKRYPNGFSYEDSINREENRGT